MKRFVVWLWIMSLLCGCSVLMERKIRGPEDVLARLPGWRFPRFVDDLDRGSLKKAVQGSLGYFRSLPEDHRIQFGPDTYSVSQMVSSLEDFLVLLDSAETPEELDGLISRHFHVYESVGRGWRRQVLFTGYYEPVVAGSRTPDKNYPHPLYRTPDELVSVKLGVFNLRLEGQRIVGRLEKGRLIPFYTRKEIDGNGALNGKGYEIAWLADKVDRYFLQIQGSGLVKLENGAYVRVNYDGSNGKPYRSIGKLLIDRGKIKRNRMSMQRIRAYFQEHPGEIDEILFHDESYSFFRIASIGPLGNINIPLTTGRSIATDSSLFPKGALTFIKTEKPVFGGDGKIIGWEAFSRFVVNQDTGGAIRGPARVDLFWGEGEEAAISAGHMKQKGRLYFLIAK